MLSNVTGLTNGHKKENIPTANVNKLSHLAETNRKNPSLLGQNKKVKVFVISSILMLTFGFNVSIWHLIFKT